MKMKAPDGVIEMMVGGTVYEVDENGVVDVPVHVAAELEFHRFVQWIDPKITVKTKTDVAKSADPAPVETPKV